MILIQIETNEYSIILTTSFYDNNWKNNNKEENFQNFSSFQFFVYKLSMIVCFGTAPQTTVLNNFLDTCKFLGELLLFDREMISAQFLCRNVLKRELERDVKNSNF